MSGLVGEEVPLMYQEEKDNTIRNLLFVVYQDQSFVYNLHCFRDLVNNETNLLLIPHLGKYINALKLGYIRREGNFNVLYINYDDIVKVSGLSLLRKFISDDT